MAKINVDNKDVEVLSEAMFCYYFALKLKGKLNQYRQQDWNSILRKSDLDSWTRQNGIYSIVARVNSDPAFLSRLNKVPTFLIEKGWHERLVAQQEKFFSKYTFSSNFLAMRADEIPSIYDPYKVYEVSSQKAKTAYGFKGTVDKDKWNPSDVWIFSPKSIQVLKKYVSKLGDSILKNDEYKVGFLNALNNKIYDLFKKRLLYPVSLKAPSGAVKIVEENTRFSSIKKVVRYTQMKYENNNQDAKIGFAVDLYDEITKKIIKKDEIVGNIKTKTVKSGGARLEVEVKGGGARYGSMGTENYQWIIKETDSSGINSLNQLRSKHPELKKYWGSGAEWLSRKNLLGEFKKDPKKFAAEIEPYTQTLYKHLNNSPWDATTAELSARTPEEAWLNKTHAGEVAVAVNDIMNKIKRDLTVENLFDLAASQRLSAGVRPEQLDRRRNTLSRELQADLNAIPPASASIIWNACFYIVVK
jgi:hypothetical protein